MTEFSNVLDNPRQVGILEDMEPISVLLMLLNRRMPSVHYHVARWSFTSIPKRPVICEFIFVAIVVPRVTSEQEDEWVVTGRCNPFVALAFEDTMDLPPAVQLSILEIPVFDRDTVRCILNLD